MFATSLLLTVLAWASTKASAHVLARQGVSNDGIHLAVGPNCASSLTGNNSDVNAGLPPLSTFKTIVAFGDSYTDGGIRNGSTLLPAVLDPPNPKAGERTTNGPVWVEDLANDVGARLMDYAWGGAVTDASLWPSKANASDFYSQSNLFISQENNLDPATTLYTAFFGINDYGAAQTDGDHMPEAAETIVYLLAVLSSAPVFARNILVLMDVERGSAPTAESEGFKQEVFEGLNALRTQLGLNVGWVDFKTIWDGVLIGPPGYAAFGYTSSGACTVNDQTMVGDCSDPAHTFYWIPGHPSFETHRIMADYIEEVMEECTISQ